MSEHLKLGKIIRSPQKRDAIHVAVAPVTAGMILGRAQHVRLHNGRAVSCRAEESIGVVDPFLDSCAVEGDVIWLWLAPGSITSLRHAWTHPSFSGEESIDVCPSHNAKSESIRWIATWCEEVGVSFEAAIANAKSWLEYGEYWCEGGRFEGESVPDEFWKHFEIATGTVVPEGKKRSFFTCSC